MTSHNQGVYLICVCPNGPSSCVTESEWIVVNVHHADPEDGAIRYKCKNCDGIVEQRSTKQKFQLNFSQLKYPCPKCNRKYFTRKQLKLHSLRHNRKTRFCSFCDKGFLTKNELRNHLNTHTRQKPFRCPVCSLRFAHSSRYYAHVQRIHKKYECNDCFSKLCSSPSPNRLASICESVSS